MRIHTWVWRRVRRRRIAKRKSASKKSRSDYLKYKEKTRALVAQKITDFNSFYKFSFKRVSIKNHKSRWGSCSKKGNLNFNYKLALIPEELVEYVVVHELCHLGEFNHSKDFWKLVEVTLPNYKELRKQLHQIRL